MINDYQIKSGINKEELKKLSLYLQTVEERDFASSILLNEIIENEPKKLFEPYKIDEDTVFPTQDLAFLYNNDEIIGHAVFELSREETSFGHKTSIKNLEKYSFVDISYDFYDEYIKKRLSGYDRLDFNIDEKSHKK